MPVNHPPRGPRLTRAAVVSTIAGCLCYCVANVSSCAISKLEIDPALGQGGSYKTSSVPNVASFGGARPGGGESGTTTDTAAGGVKSVGGAWNGTGAGGIGGSSVTTAPLTVPACLGVALPMVRGGAIRSADNGCGIVGSWYWFKDSPSAANPLETKVSSPTDPNVTSVVEPGGKACLKGETVLDPEFGAWGAGVGFDFVNSGQGKKAYDATARQIGGFEVTITGEFPQGLRIQFNAPLQAETEPPPFVSVARAGTYRVRLADAFVPTSWANVSNAGAAVDPTKLGSLQVQVVGGEKSAPFDFCVETIIPLPIQDEGDLGKKPVRFVALPLPETSLFAAASNLAEIQGHYYCVGATGNAIRCGTVGGTGPYRANVVGAAGGMCVSGSMTKSEDDWGALIGLNLKQASATAERQPYSALANKLRGFRFETAITPAWLPLQVKAGSITTFPENEVLPLRELAQSGQHLVEFGNVVCPNWQGTTCTSLDPSSVYMFEIGVATTLAATDFDLCVTKLEAMIER